MFVTNPVILTESFLKGNTDVNFHVIMYMPYT